MKYAAWKKALSLLLILTCCWTAPAVLPSEWDPAATVQAEGLFELNTSKATLGAGSTLKLKLLGALPISVFWSSSNEAVATVSASGKVTARKKGVAGITAMYLGKKYTAVITVVPALNTKKATLAAGKTLKLTLKGASGTVKWRSSNKAVATVSSAGIVTARRKGTAKIYAIYGGKKYTATITVKPALSKTKATLAAGKTLKLTLKGASGTVKWRSSNKTVATVSSKGVVTARKKGIAKIYATCGGKKYTATITVKPVLSKTKATLSVGKTLKLTLKGASGTVKWRSSNKTVATVSSKGVVTARKEGTAKIYATCGGEKYAATITVKPVLSKTKATLTAGSSLKLALKGAAGTVKWSSSDSSVAAVSSKGVVTAKTKGSATISAVSSGKKYTCSVTVHPIQGDLHTLIGKNITVRKDGFADPLKNDGKHNGYDVYANGAVTVYAYQDAISHIELSRSGGNKYTFFGVYCGMDWTQAQNQLESKGLTKYVISNEAGSTSLYFEYYYENGNYCLHGNVSGDKIIYLNYGIPGNG